MVFFQARDLTKGFAYNSLREIGCILIVESTSIDVSTKGVPDPQTLGQLSVYLKMSATVD